MRANELRTDGEDVAQMLVQRDKEAEAEAAALRARVAELAELLTSASSAMPEWFAHLHERIDAALGATKGEGHDPLS